MESFNFSVDDGRIDFVVVCHTKRLMCPVCGAVEPPVHDRIERPWRHFRGTKLRGSDAALDDFKHRIRPLTVRSWGVSMGCRRCKLGGYLRGWAGYFGISQYYRPVTGIDDWIRRRIRMCYWKQWRYVRAKVRHLLALGTYKRQAILTAISSKSYWRRAKTLATHSGVTNDGLKQQRLISFRDLWIKAQGYV